MAASHRLYSYAGCSTCRRALAWLRERAIAVEVIDITTSPPDVALLGQALGQLGRSRLFNTSGQSYRALGASVVRGMDDGQALAALAADGRLIKRPLLITAAGTMATGFRPEEWQELLA
jgi:arsenate reductase